MTLSEKSAYLKGLMEGMKLDTETNEGKLISEIISMLQDVAENVSDLFSKSHQLRRDKNSTVPHTPA